LVQAKHLVFDVVYLYLVYPNQVLPLVELEQESVLEKEESKEELPLVELMAMYLDFQLHNPFHVT
jgi:hypothetical protein